MSQKEVPTALKFAFGGLSGCGAATVVQPMDLVKNRMQVFEINILEKLIISATFFCLFVHQ